MLVVLNLGAIAALLYHRHLQNLKAAQTALETFSRKLIESQEAERKRIAGELHDSLGQGLLVIRNQALMALRVAPGAAQDHVMEIAAAAAHAIDEVRAIAYALRPYQLDRLGLTRAVESMIERVSGSTGIAFTCKLDALDGLFEKESEVSLYRIVQESVNNIARHSAATEASLEIHRRGASVRATIADNGRGFAFDPDHAGLGLVGIRERARLLGGTSHIVSAPGAGTRVAIQIRCQKEGHARRSDGADRRRSSDLPEGAVAGSRG